MARYLVYDVFTDTPFGGNPLAVVRDGPALPEARLQAITREFGFSETVFLYPPEAPGHAARVRIFTPTQEVPFAGHPTIGTAVALADLGQGGEITLELGIGPVACVAEPGRARFTVRRPLQRLHAPAPADVAACLSLPVSALASDPAPVVASMGLPFALVRLASRADLAACRPDEAAFARAIARYPMPFDFPVYAYVPEGETVHARMFAPLDDMVEDPATGSAATALAALLAEAAGPVELVIRQGEDMGRPSRIGAAARLRDGAAEVTISGAAVRVMEGRLTLPEAP